jgi:hypothetical protein
MSSNAELHLAYKVANAPLSLLQSKLPEPTHMVPLDEARPVSKGSYRERFVLTFGGDRFAGLPDEQRRFWGDLHRWLLSGVFRNLMLEKFRGFINQRFQGQTVTFYDEALLVQDTTNYSLGPHSDSPRKVITFLFHLPKDESQRHLGTSIYVPKERNFRCAGGPHYQHAHFDRLWTMPFVPNSLFVFFKTDASFHGVEPIGDADTRRWLLLYDIFHRVESPQ